MTANPIAHALRRLENSDSLRALENRLAEQSAFNLFDAVGVARQELRHSDFLAFLLRPNEAHGLGDTFLRWFLETALAQSAAPPLALATLHQWDLRDAHVGRESQNIDLFITSATNGLAVVVENKIDTGEHSDQLTRYRDNAISHGYSGPNKALLCIYLTPRGDAPSHADYLPLSYQSICSHLETLCKTGAFDHAASPDVVMVVRHYTRMLRNQSIVSDPEIAELCRKMYEQHKEAIDKIIDLKDSFLGAGGRTYGRKTREEQQLKAEELIIKYFQSLPEGERVERQRIMQEVLAENIVGQPAINNALEHLSTYGDPPRLNKERVRGKGGNPPFVFWLSTENTCTD